MNVSSPTFLIKIFTSRLCVILGNIHHFHQYQGFFYSSILIYEMKIQQRNNKCLKFIIKKKIKLQRKTHPNVKMSELKKYLYG